MSDIWFLRQALVDLRDARGWYDEQRLGLGDEFANAVESAIESILAFPTAHLLVHRDAHRILLERFPYCLYYRVHSEAVIVVAILHVARDPERDRSRLRG